MWGVYSPKTRNKRTNALVSAVSSAAVMVIVGRPKPKTKPVDTSAAPPAGILAMVPDFSLPSMINPPSRVIDQSTSVASASPTFCISAVHLFHQK